MADEGVAARDWYEAIPFADGVTLIHEPWIHPYFRCNMWHVRGRDRDLLIDAGLGAVPLRAHLGLLSRDRPIVLALSHTHFDHIGAAHEFEARLVHPQEADILAAPSNDRTLAADYARPGVDRAMFIRPPPGWDAGSYAVRPAPATGSLEEGGTVDLGDRLFAVLHAPGHSPGHVCLFEERTGILFAADLVYDGPLVWQCAGADLDAYRPSLRRVRDLPCSIVHAGHFSSFGQVRLRQLVDAFLDEHPLA